jgi:hypothetical protein
VWQEAPGGGVPLRGKQVAPVLPDEPRTEKGHDFRSVCYSPDLGEPSHEEDGEDAESKRELVDAKATEVDARTETMSFEAQHARRVDIDR